MNSVNSQIAAGSITALVQPSEEGNLHTHRLPEGCAVAITSDFYTINEDVPDNSAPKDAKIPSRFKIVKITSDKPKKRFRWTYRDSADKDKDKQPITRPQRRSP